MGRREDIVHEGAAALVERAARDGGVRRIVQALTDGETRIGASGLRGSSAVVAIEAVRLALGRPIVIYCPEEETARDVFADFQTVSGGRVVFLPERDILPRPLEVRENLVVRGSRNACLDRILHERADIVVTSLLGFLEKTLPAPVFRRHAREIRVGSALEMEDLREHLVLVGYEGASIVEEPGQFAVRGAIFDIFDPSREHPVRLEFSDDAVASMRTFDIESQKSYESLDAVRLLPAAGVILDDASPEAVESRLRGAGVDGAAVEHVRRELDDHRASPLLRRYAPLLGNDGAMLDFFPRPPVVFAWDEEGHARRLEALETEVTPAEAPGDSGARGASGRRHEGAGRRDESGEGPAGVGEGHTSDQRHAAPTPPLGLFDYLHRPDYAEARGVPGVHLWGLAAAETDTPRDTVRFRTSEHPPILGKLDTLIQTIRKLRAKGMDVVIYSESPVQRERLADMLEEDEDLVHLPVGWFTHGFLWESVGLAVLTDHEIFHRLLPRPRQRQPGRRTETRRPDRLHAGDFVVHIDYGVGRYLGLDKLVTDGQETECLQIKYHGTDRIYVPLEQMGLVEKYVGKEGAAPVLDRLGSAKWQRTKEKTRRVLEDVARDLLEVYAAREVVEKAPFGPDTAWQRELEASFPFEETPHQLRSTEEIKRDMESAKPMDRLVCGDVGFGKTEVAVRAAFKAVSQGKQVAILVPTTILAYQHYNTFRERMAAFPVNVEMLSRFRTPSEQKRIIEAIREGRVDVVIGTHRLLSSDVRFHDIGLLIVDEEHRFGVRNKEKIKRIKRAVDVLSMTATPIPRTLYMALSGLRHISVIDTPPRNRHPIKTEVLLFDEEAIAEAILNEIHRGGQVFLVHNRIGSILAMQAFLERLLPGTRFRAAHGQMAEKELERVILAFLNREFDVLISTTIIESGLDFPNVNTIIVNRADRFGLAELYQLRGRVGRREQQAYAYLLVPRDFAITETAGKRLQAMEEFEELGSGYRLAMRDLEIRGAGNVLGVEQHGQVAAVGFDLYCKMLKEAVERLKGEVEPERPPCRVETRLPSFLPDDYVEDQDERMTLYKRLARLEAPEEVDDIEQELEDRFGRLPPASANLIALTRIKLRAAALGVALVQLRSDRVVVEFLPERALPPPLCAQLVETFEGRVLFKSNKPFGLSIALGPRGDALGEARKLLREAYYYVKKDSYPKREGPT